MNQPEGTNKQNLTDLLAIPVEEMDNLSKQELIALLGATAAETIIVDPEQEQPPKIGKYGKMAMKQMQQTDPGGLNILILEGHHREFFQWIDEQAWELYEATEKSLRSQNPPPKGEDFLKLAQYNNNLQIQANEIVMEEVSKMISQP